LAVNFHGGTRSMGLMLASAAPIRVGFGHHAHSYLYSAKIPRAQEILGDERPVHTVEHLASAMFWMGVPRAEIPPARLFAPGLALVDRPYAVIHPFAARADKAWPAERFLTVANRLRERAGLESVFIGGPSDDFAPFIGFRQLRNAPLSDVKRVMCAAQL